ncbi:hypothetical protein AB0C11_37850 [Streptomyces sp. NPDC039016]|uniref:hypothetical protein n=1 Tax=Streptomyces sp. NPDC039016 TaxID=3154330 RepID=UPI00340F903A
MPCSPRSVPCPPPIRAHLEEQEREIAAQAEAIRGRNAELTAQLQEFGPGAEEVRIARKTLLTLPVPSPPTPPAAKLPDHRLHTLPNPG